MRRGRLLLGGILLGGALVAALLAAGRLAADPIAVVHAWDAARNRGDVDAAMGYLADDGQVAGFSLRSPGQRSLLRGVLEGQAAANYRIEDAECTVAGAVVTCRYAQDDEILRRWGMTFTGTHEIEVRDGKITRLVRAHDRDVQDEIYAAALRLRSWVREAHPELYDVIWVDDTTTLYSTRAGAEALLRIIDEYEPAGA
jgi:hypothetical protein